MSSPFFITGLPRCRTSWLANLFTTGDQFCYHDLLGKVASLREFSERVRGGRGDADSGLLFLWPTIHAMFPEARWLVIARDAVQCIESLQRAAVGTSWEEKAAEFARTANTWRRLYGQRLVQMIRHPQVHIINFAELDDYGAVAEAWQFLRPGTELARERFNLLDGLRVEPIPAKSPLRLSAGIEEEIKKLWQLHP